MTPAQRAADFATWVGGQIKATRAYADQRITTAVATATTSLQAYADQKAAQVKADIEGSATGAFDTLGELQARLESDATGIAAVVTSLGKRVAVDVVQAFTSDEKAQGRANIGAAGLADLGPDTDLVALAVAARDS